MSDRNQTKHSPPVEPDPPADDRRGFVAKTLAVAIGGFVGLFPLAAGLFTFANPLKSRAKGPDAADDKPGQLVRIATLAALPDDGVPRQFPVIADRQDAWTRYPDEAIGAVYLRRQPGSEEVQAFNATCPHLGCFVNFNRQRDVYQCPCHASDFSVEGEVQGGPAPRDLDRLEAELRPAGDQREVWVRFVDYYTGTSSKVPKT